MRRHVRGRHLSGGLQLLPIRGVRSQSRQKGPGRIRGAVGRHHRRDRRPAVGDMGRRPVPRPLRGLLSHRKHPRHTRSGDGGDVPCRPANRKHAAVRWFGAEGRSA